MGQVRKLITNFSRFVFVLLALLSAFVFTMFQGGYVSWTIFYAILPFAVYSIALFFYPLSSLTAERIIRTPGVQNGGKFIVTLAVKRNFRFPLLYTVVSDKWREELLVTEGKLKKIFVFGFRNEMKWDYEVERMPRGEHVLEGVEIELSDFFGWIRKTHFIPIKNKVLVYPKMTDIQYVPLDTQYDRGTTVSPYNIVKDTTMATGVRDYQSGDRFSWIHWKSFARTQTLMTKEFEDRRSQDLFIVFDGRASEVFEEQVELAASILKEASNHQAGIGFVSTGSMRESYPIIQSEEQFKRVLTHLAKIKPTEDAAMTLPGDYKNGFQHGGSIILITGRPDWEFLESVVSNVMNARSIVCFTVIKKVSSMKGDLAEDIQYAKSKGIALHTVTKEQFSTAFKGVTHA